MCPPKVKQPEPAPPPPPAPPAPEAPADAPKQKASTAGEQTDGITKRRRGVAALRIPLNQPAASSSGLSLPS